MSVVNASGKQYEFPMDLKPVQWSVPAMETPHDDMPKRYIHYRVGMSNQTIRVMPAGKDGYSYSFKYKHGMSELDNHYRTHHISPATYDLFSW